MVDTRGSSDEAVWGPIPATHHRPGLLHLLSAGPHRLSLAAITRRSQRSGAGAVPKLFASRSLGSLVPAATMRAALVQSPVRGRVLMTTSSSPLDRRPLGDLDSSTPGEEGGSLPRFPAGRQARRGHGAAFAASTPAASRYDLNSLGASLDACGALASALVDGSRLWSRWRRRTARSSPYARSPHPLRVGRRNVTRDRYCARYGATGLWVRRERGLINPGPSRRYVRDVPPSPPPLVRVIASSQPAY